MLRLSRTNPSNWLHRLLSAINHARTPSPLGSSAHLIAAAHFTTMEHALAQSQTQTQIREGETQTQSHTKRPHLESRRSSSSTHNEPSSNSPSELSAAHRTKAKPHVVNRTHIRAPSHGKLHKLSKVHHVEGNNAARLNRRPQTPDASTSPQSSPMRRVGSEPRISRNNSTVSLKRNSSHVALKRNRSIVERPKSAGTLRRTPSHVGLQGNKGILPRTSVRFDLGNDIEGQEDGWTEASASASPNVSRAHSRANSEGGLSSGRSSAKPPASNNNSRPGSVSTSPTRRNQGTSSDWTSSRDTNRNIAPDARQITSRLLQRTPSHNAPPKMSSVSVTATPGNRSPDLYGQSRAGMLNGTPGRKQDEVVSRFVGSGPGTPGDGSPYLVARAPGRLEPQKRLDEGRRAQSMANLTRRESHHDDNDDEQRALQPRSRKSSTGRYDALPPSRAQQKLWLERQSSNIEFRQVASLSGLNGFTTTHGGPAIIAPGAGFDGRTEMTPLQRAGTEYRVVRRYQDPVGDAIKRMHKVAGADKTRKIPLRSKQRSDIGGRNELSESLKGIRNGDSGANNGDLHSFEGPGSRPGSVGSERSRGHDASVDAILRGLWEKSFELSASAE